MFRDPALAHEVQQVLDEMQAPLQERRAFDRQMTFLKETLKTHQRAFDLQLAASGLHRKGSEVRGWRAVRARLGGEVKHDRDD